MPIPNPLGDKKWYYNSASGRVGSEYQAVMWPQLKAGLDWHGPFDSKQDALNYYEKNKAKNPGWKAPTDSATEAIKTQVEDTLGGFNIAGWFIRIGEILLGLVLVGVGVAKLTGTSNVISKVAKVAV